MAKAGNLYDNRFIGYGYDVLSHLVWLPSKDALYTDCLSFMKDTIDAEILELGCGTGYLTQKMIATGARVTGIDQSAGMLARAREKAPQAIYFQDNFLSYCDDKKYDFVVIFFVLHELDKTARITLLKRARNFLKESGRIVVADFAAPKGAVAKKLFPALLRLWEPPSTREVMGGFSEEMRQSDLVAEKSRSLRGGRVQWLLMKTKNVGS